MGEFVRTLKTSEAAAVLNVSPNTLRAWERRFGYPKPQRTAGKHRLYTHGEVAALRSVERSVEEVLLPSIREIGERHGFDSAPWAFAARWATDWLQRAQRMAP